MTQEPDWTPELEAAFRERYGAGTGDPPGWTPELEDEFQARYGPGPGRWAAQTGRSVVGGALEAVGGLWRAPGELGRLVGRTVLPEGETRDKALELGERFDLGGIAGRGLQKAGEYVSEDPIVNVSPDGVGRFLAKDAAGAVGQSAPFFATGGAGAAAGLGTRAAAGLSAVTGVVANAQQSLQEAEDMGASVPEQWGAMLVGGGLGALEAAEPALIFARLGKAAPGLMGALRAALVEGMTEGVTESVQQLGQDLYAKGTFDPERDLAGWERAGAAGGVAGAFISALVSGAHGARRPRKPGQQELPLEPEKPAPPAATPVQAPETARADDEKPLVLGPDAAIVDRLVNLARAHGYPMEEGEASFRSDIKMALIDAEDMEAEIARLEAEFMGESEEQPAPRPIEVVKPPEAAPVEPPPAKGAVAAASVQQKANVVVREVRTRDGDLLGHVVEPHDGSPEGIIAAARRATDRMWEQFPDAGNMGSAIRATDETGAARWDVSPNLLHLTELNTAALRKAFGEEAASGAEGSAVAPPETKPVEAETPPAKVEPTAPKPEAKPAFKVDSLTTDEDAWDAGLTHYVDAKGIARFRDTTGKGSYSANIRRVPGEQGTGAYVYEIAFSPRSNVGGFIDYGSEHQDIDQARAELRDRLKREGLPAVVAGQLPAKLTYSGSWKPGALERQPGYEPETHQKSQEFIEGVKGTIGRFQQEQQAQARADGPRPSFGENRPRFGEWVTEDDVRSGRLAQAIKDYGDFYVVLKWEMREREILKASDFAKHYDKIVGGAGAEFSTRGTKNSDRLREVFVRKDPFEGLEATAEQRAAGKVFGVEGGKPLAPQGYQRKTPAPGTKERAELEAEHKAVDKDARELNELIGPLEQKVETLTKERDKMRRNAYNKRQQHQAKIDALKTQIGATRKTFNDARNLDARVKQRDEEQSRIYLEDTALGADGPRKLYALVKLNAMPYADAKRAALQEIEKRVAPDFKVEATYSARVGDSLHYEQRKYSEPVNAEARTFGVTQAADSVVAMGGPQTWEEAVRLAEVRARDAVRSQIVKRVNEQFTAAGFEQSQVMSDLRHADKLEDVLKIEASSGQALRGLIAQRAANEAREAAVEKFDLEVWANLVDPSEVTVKKSAWNGNMAASDSAWAADGRSAMLKSAVVDKKARAAIEKRNDASRYGPEGVPDAQLQRLARDAVKQAPPIKEIVGAYDPRLLAKRLPGFAERAKFVNREEDFPLVYVVLGDGTTAAYNADYFALIHAAKPDELRAKDNKGPLVAMKGGEPVALLMPVTLEGNFDIETIRAKQAKARESIALQNQVAQEENPAEESADFAKDELGEQREPALPEDRALVDRTRRPADPAQGGPVLSPEAVHSLAGYPAQGIPPGQEEFDRQGRLYGNLQTPQGWKRAPVRVESIMQSMVDVLKAAGSTALQRHGRITRQQGARGYFLPIANINRINNARNVSTAAHELGHALERAAFGWLPGGPWKLPLIGKKVQEELVALGRKLYGDTAPSGGYKREGFAEYLRLYLAQPELVAKEAPQFHAWFEGTFLRQNPAIGEALDDTRDLLTAYRMQGAALRESASRVDPASAGERLRSAGKTVKRTLSMRAWWDIFTPLVEPERVAARGLVTWYDQVAAVDKELALAQLVHHMKLPADRALAIVEHARKTGRLPHDLSPFTIARATRQMHTGRVDQWVWGDGVTDLTGFNLVGPSLRQVLAPVRSRGELFMVYLRALRSEHLWQTERDPGMSLEDARALREALERENPDFAETQERFVQWWDSVVDYAAQASPTFARSIKVMRAADPEGAAVYVTLQREFEEMDVDRQGKGGWGGSVFQGRVSSRLKGSGRRVKDILPAMLTKAEQLVLRAHKRMVLDAIIKLSYLPDVGPYAVEVPARSVPVYEATVEELRNRIKKQLARRGYQSVELEAVDEELGEVMPGALDEVADEAVTFFMPEMPSDNGQPLIPVYDSAANKVRYFEVDRELYDTLMGMELYRLPKMAEWLCSVPREIYRMGTTGLRASFGLVTNPIRDAQTAYTNTRASANGGRMFMEILRMYGMAALDRVTAGKVSDPYIQALRRMGGEMTMPLSADSPHSARTASLLFAGRAQITLSPTNLYRVVRDLIQTFEIAPRAAELKMVAKDIGWDPSRSMTMSQSLQLINAFSTVTTDFRAAGAYAQAWNRIAPFFNSSIQGPRSFIEAIRRNPRRVGFVGLQMAMLSIGLWWATKDEDWREELDPGEDYRFWHIPVTIGERKTLVRIPRPFEIGGLFGALPEALFRAWYDQEPDAAGQWAKQFVENSTPNPWPVLVQEGAEQLANRDFWTNTPIVPRGQEEGPLEEQYNEATSRLAVKLGTLFNWSPRRIDHAIGGVMGGLGHDLLQAVGGRATVAENEPADLPVLGVLFMRGGELGTRPESIDSVYAAYAQAVQRSKSKKNPETPEQRQMRLMLEDATKAFTAGFFVRSHTVEAAKRDAITKELVEIARDTLEKMSGGRANRSRNYLERKRWEFERSSAEYRTKRDVELGR